jgi:adenylyltransferase/sulfurtransferase
VARYQRQIAFAPLGAAGQRKMAASRVAMVGLGGLGSWCAELLARAGVGFLRLIDDDHLDVTNLHRQGMYTVGAAYMHRAKVERAADHLAAYNEDTRVEAVQARLEPGNAESLCGDVDVIVDGTDNFASRMLINDVAVKLGVPWVMAGVVGAEGQYMTIVPGQGPCLRCVMDEMPPPCEDPSCRTVGVLGPAVATLSAMQAMEVIKLLSGHPGDCSRDLVKLDLWGNSFQRMGLADARDPECPCCGRGQWEYLEP